jgi:hypothetical protein
MHGISEARYIPAVLALIAEYHKDATRSLATGIHMSGPYAGLALSGRRHVYDSELLGWEYRFYVFGLFGSCMPSYC